MEIKESKIPCQENSKYETIDEIIKLKDINTFSTQSNVIDQIFNKRGYDISCLKCIFLTICTLASEGLQMTLFSTMIIPLKRFFDVPDTIMGLISSSIFLGVGLGSLLSGFFSNKYGRTFTINSLMFIIFIANISLCVTNNYLIFILLRLIIGFGIGLIVPISINLLTEYLPIKNRSLVLTSIWVGFSLGSVYLLTLMYFLMPNYELDQVQLTIFLSSFLSFLTFLFHYYYLKDSPRNLILNGNTDEAFEILERSCHKLNENVKSRIIREIKNANFHTDTVFQVKIHFFEIFKGKYTKLTFLLAMVWFIDSFVTYGLGIIQTFTLKTLGEKLNNYQNKEIILKQIVIIIISASGNLIGGSLSEVSFLGRNKTTSITFFVSASFLILLIIFSNYFTIFFSLAQLLWSVALNVNTAYSCEVYPTHIRDHAIGFLFFSTRVGGFISQFIYLYLNRIDIWTPYYVAAFLFYVNGIIVCNFPYETYGTSLDDTDSLKNQKENDTN